MAKITAKHIAFVLAGLLVGVIAYHVIVAKRAPTAGTRVAVRSTGIIVT